MLDTITSKSKNKLKLADFLLLPAFEQDYSNYADMNSDCDADRTINEFIDTEDLEYNLEQLACNLKFYGRFFNARLQAFYRLTEDGLEKVKEKSDINEPLTIKINDQLIVGQWCRLEAIIYVTYNTVTDTHPGHTVGGKENLYRDDKSTAEWMLKNLFDHMEGEA